VVNALKPFAASQNSPEASAQPVHESASSKNAVSLHDVEAEDESGGPPEEVVEAKTVALQFKNLPPNASVTINGKATALPAVIAQSSDAVAVQVFSGNYLVYTSSVAPTSDLVLEIPSVKKHRKKRKSDSGAGAGKTKPDASGSLSSNPFSLRTNPFAKGESK
jgi:hypothetical protein